MDAYTLLVIARSQSLVASLRGVLDPESYLIRWVKSTTQALDLGVQPSLLILELPPSGGARCASWLKRRFEAPLLALTGPGQTIPSAVDEASSQPHSWSRLVELIERILIDHSPHAVQAAGISLDTETRRLQIQGQICQLRPIGSQIMAQLMMRAGEVVPRDVLFRQVWRTDDGDNTRALDVHIAYLRRQIEPNPRQPSLIITERGVGYRLQPPA